MAVNPNIKKKADDIRNKIYGKEVRESLASGLEAMSSDVVKNEGRQSVVESRQDSVESQWQNVVDETTGKDVISAPEIIAARNGEANLKTRLDKENAQLAQIETNVKDFGAKGDGVTDDTQAINLAIENTRVGGRVNFPEGVYMIDGYDETAWNGKGDTGIKVRKPLTININGGATVKQISKSDRNSIYYYGYLIFEVIDTNNVIFEGKGTIEGDRKEHTGVEGDYKGEHGIGIFINNSQNVVVRDLTIKDTWGDGIEIQNSSKDVTVDNVIIDHVRRNGISVLEAENVNIINSTIKNVVGTMPQAGIDIEPNPGENPADNVTISNCVFLNNKTQDIVFGGGAGCDNIFINDCYFNTQRHSIVIVGNNPNSTVNISNCFIRTKYGVFTLGGFKNTYIDNVVVEPNIPHDVEAVAIDVDMKGFSPNIYIDGLKNVNNFFIVFDITGSDGKAHLNITNSSFSTTGNALFRGSSKELQIVMKHNTIKDSPLSSGAITVENGVFDYNQFSDSNFNVAKLSNTHITNNRFIVERYLEQISSSNSENNIISNNIFKVNKDVEMMLIDIRIDSADKENGVVRLLPNTLTNNTIISKEDAIVWTEPEDILKNSIIKGGILQEG